MTEFTIRSDAVNVEEIMRQIRARIREKRGVDYAEDEIQELAHVRLEKFLDPRKVRSELIEHYRRQRPVAPVELPSVPNYGFEDTTLYVSSRGLMGRLITSIRRVLNPVLKLFLNPNPIVHALHMQSEVNDHNARLFERVAQALNVRQELDALHYELLNNLVVELTRLGIDVKNLKMRVESLSSRLDFDERRARALEGAVQYRPGAADLSAASAAAAQTPEETQPAGAAAGSEGRRRRRRRRGRRRGAPSVLPTGGGPHHPAAAPGAAESAGPPSAAPEMAVPTPPAPEDAGEPDP